MSMLNDATDPTAMRPPGFNLLWLVLGLAVALVPLALLWHFLGSNFAGGDGKLHQTLIDAYLRFGAWGELITRDPLEGAWNVGIPINVWLNPALVPFSFMSVKDAKLWSGAICYIAYAASWYLLLRSVGAPALRSAVISQFAFIGFDPFYYLFGWPANLALRPWVAIMFALALVVASLLVRINSFRLSTIIANAAAIAVIISYGIDLDGIWAVSLLTTAAVPLAIIVCERGLKAATAARCLVLLLALGLVYGLGPGRFLVAMAENTSRYLEPKLNTYAQIPVLASSVFNYTETKYVFAILILGWVLGLSFSSGRVRLLPIVAALSFAAQLVFIVIFLFADIRWILPPPSYYQMVFTPFYVIGAGVGYAALLSTVVAWVSRQRKPNLLAKTPILRTARVVGSLVCLGLAPSYLAYTWANEEMLKTLIEDWSPDTQMVDFLAQQVGLVPNARFRGSAVIMEEDYPGQLTQDSLLRAHVPMLNDYNDLVTEQLFVLLHELIAKGDNGALSNRLPLFRSPAPDWATTYVNVTGALGARFILARAPLDFSAALAPAMRDLTERQFPGWDPDAWYVYELPATNTGNYSPTTVDKIVSAPDMLDKMASPRFDYRKEVVVTEDLGETLVPLGELALSFERGAARVQATSAGTSLALLPLQYSHCLRSSDPRARLVRADLAMTGLVFKGTIDAKISDDFGPFTPGCRGADNADIRRLKIAIGPFPTPPDEERRPTAIRRAADLVPNVMEVLRQIR
jgi:hypothetical protein